jgi:hypothetical protein
VSEYCKIHNKLVNKAFEQNVELEMLKDLANIIITEL